MDSLKLFTDLNAQAIGLMMAGNHKESTRTMIQALQELYACTDSVELMQQEGAGQAVAMSGGPLLPACFISVPLELTAKMLDPTLLETNIFTFCPRMFHVGSLEDALQLGVPKVLMIALFNTAMARHISNLSAKRVNTRNLHAVASLYNKVLEVGNTSLGPDDNDAQQMASVLAATMNNMGHIASHLLLFTETQSCITMLMNLLSSMTVYAEDQQEAANIAADDLVLFYSSICVFLDSAGLCVAPAA